MRRPLAALLAVAAVLAPCHPVVAQRAQTRPGTLAGLRFTLPARFTPVPALSDAETAVYADTVRDEWAFVALLPRAAARPAVVGRLAGRLNGTVAGSAQAGVEW